MAVKTRYRKARFVYSGYTAREMGGFGQVLSDDIKDRMLAGIDKRDQPTAPLVEQYARWKKRRYPPAIRNFRKTGRSLRSLGVLRANENTAVIGLADPVAQRRASFNGEMWGASPNNWEAVNRAIREGRPVVTVARVS